MDDHADAEAARQAPYVALAGAPLFLRYIEGPAPLLLGIYDTPDDTPGVTSLPVPSGWASRTLRDITRVAEAIDDAVPGLGDIIRPRRG